MVLPVHDPYKTKSSLVLAGLPVEVIVKRYAPVTGAVNLPTLPCDEPFPASSDVTLLPLS